MDALEEYIAGDLAVDFERDKIATKFINDFISRFPKEKILSMNIESFFYAPKESGYEKSFCYQLMYSPLASMGQCHPDIFGIYLKGGHTLVLSPTYKKVGLDYYEAFEEIKKDIIKLFESADSLNFECIDSNRLNSAFKVILLAVYYSEKFMPAPTLTALNAYCNALDVATNFKETKLFRNHALVEWKNSVSQCRSWSTFVLMSFCDRLWRKNKTINGKEYVSHEIANKAKQIETDIIGLNICGTDKEAVVKSRVNQGVFRARLLNRYDSCCLCGVSNPQLLVASHIKPWSMCKPSEKLDVDNGFLLCAGHDRLFDLGYISFSGDGKIMISNELSKIDQIFTNVNESIKIKLTEENKEYLKYHRNNIFRK